MNSHYVSYILEDGGLVSLLRKFNLQTWQLFGRVARVSNQNMKAQE